MSAPRAAKLPSKTPHAPRRLGGPNPRATNEPKGRQREAKFETHGEASPKRAKRSEPTVLAQGKIGDRIAQEEEERQQQGVLLQNLLYAFAGQ